MSDAAVKPSSELITRLLTILNTTALRPSSLKRKRESWKDWHEIAKRVKLDKVSLDDDATATAVEDSVDAGEALLEAGLST